MKLKFFIKGRLFDSSLGELGEVVSSWAPGDVVEVPFEKVELSLQSGFACLVDINDMLEIPKDLTGDFVFVGRALGINLSHCIYLACKYNQNFREEAVGFCIENEFHHDVDLTTKIEISFWKAKTISHKGTITLSI